VQPVRIAVTYSAGFPLLTKPYQGGGEGEVDKLLTLVNIALGDAPRTACPHGVASSTGLDIALIIQAVNNAMGTCPSSDL
jgi:hypothetical protein